MSLQCSFHYYRIFTTSGKELSYIGGRSHPILEHTLILIFGDSEFVDGWLNRIHWRCLYSRPLSETRVGWWTAKSHSSFGVCTPVHALETRVDVKEWLDHIPSIYLLYPRLGANVVERMVVSILLCALSLYHRAWSLYMSTDGRFPFTLCFVPIPLDHRKMLM